jgi:hypothetical protein
MTLNIYWLLKIRNRDWCKDKKEFLVNLFCVSKTTLFVTVFTHSLREIQNK